MDVLVSAGGSSVVSHVVHVLAVKRTKYIIIRLNV